MATYTVPTTRTTGDLMTAAIVNTDYVENIKVMDLTGFDYVVDGGTIAIVTGVKHQIRFPFPMTFNNISATADLSTTADIDFLYKATQDATALTTSDFLTVGGTTDKMLQFVASTISTEYTLTNLTSATVVQGGVFACRVHANDNATRLTVHFRASKT